MPRPSRPWFRFYTEAISDRKLRRLKPSQRWLWTAVMAAARESPVTGVLLDGAEDTPMTTAGLADYAGMTEREVRATMPEFERSGMVHRNDAGAWVVSNFSRRQFESDNVTARTQRHRARDPDEPDRNVPTLFPGTANGTGNGSSQERSPSRALATESETETDLLTSSVPFQGARPEPDDEDQDQPANQGNQPPQLDQLVGTALAILVERDLDDRQQNPQLTPIADAQAWRRKATRQRSERGTPSALAELARAHPTADARTLADLLEPPRPATNGDRPDPLAGQRQALLDRAEADHDHLRAILHEPAPDPHEIERVHDTIAGVRQGLRPATPVVVDRPPTPIADPSQEPA